jgi:hypothetical protein
MLSNFKEIIIGFFIFCIILFFYLHIQYQLKTSNELEIYEIDQASKDKLEEICDLRQPIIFEDFENGKKIIAGTNKQLLLDNYPVFEVKIRETNDYNISELPLKLHVANKLFSEDKNAKYFSENNGDFLNETGAVKTMKYNDTFLRPFLVSNCNYDVMFASDNVETPLRYEINYRNYFIVTQGSVHIKLTPPNSSKYLYPIKDYENFEFRSPINPWKPQTNYKADFDKIKFLEIELTPNKFLFIPAYWWYSFKFSKNTSVSCFRYRTYMNNIAILPTIFMYALQNQNIERKIVKNLSVVSTNIDTTNIDTTNIDTTNIDTTNIDTMNIDTTNIDTTNIDTMNIDTTNIDTMNIDTMNIDTTNIDTMNIDTTNI